MENDFHSGDLRMQSYPLVWRHVQLRLSHEEYWTTRSYVAVLSVTRQRRRPLSGSVLINQIPLDSSTRLMPPTSRDLRCLRFSLQCGVKRFRFQAPNQRVFTKWCVIIANAIDRAEKEEQELQTIQGVGLDKKPYNIYRRDITEGKVTSIRLHDSANVDQEICCLQQHQGFRRSSIK